MATIKCRACLSMHGMVSSNAEPGEISVSDVRMISRKTVDDWGRVSVGTQFSGDEVTVIVVKPDMGES